MPGSFSSHDSARAGIGAKSSDALLRRVANWTFQNSYSLTANPTVGLSVSHGWVRPMMRVTSPSSWATAPGTTDTMATTASATTTIHFRKESSNSQMTAGYPT